MSGTQDSIIYDYLVQMTAQKASDLYLTVGLPPTMRKNDDFSTLSDFNLTDHDIDQVLSEVMTTRQRREFENEKEFNLAFDLGDQGRFRVNALRQKQHTALVIRRIMSEIPSFEDLTLPSVMAELIMKKRGLVLLCGVTSSGKSTSLASMIDYRNKNQAGHIITIEDPVEYYHTHKKSIITQREVGIDTESYNIALKNALRQKPDVILIGEIRDAEVMEQALMASETGHLCLATLHTNNASQAIERIINFFPEDRHQQIRLSLSMNLRAIVAQRLVNNVSGGLSLALEVMLNEAFIKELILSGKTNEIRNIIMKNNPAKMCTFDQSLYELYETGKITAETAIAESDVTTDMRIRIKQHAYTAKKSTQHQADTIDMTSLSL